MLNPMVWLRNLPVSRLVQGVNLLLVIGIGYSAAELTWRMVPTAESVGGPVPAVTSAAPVVASTMERLGTVAELGLFGRATAEPAPAVTAAIDAPETRLNLTLRGVVATGSNAAQAIIAAAGGNEESYKVGAALPGGATLEQVLPDRVILKRGGRLEALYLPKESSAGFMGASTGNAAPAYYASSVPEPMVPNMGSRLAEVRDRILSNPQEAFSLARVQPVMEGGRLKGYKLAPNKEKQLFQEAGLRPGDVVTSVNGIPLDDPATLGQVMSQITTATQLNLTVDRGGRQATLVIPFGR